MKNFRYLILIILFVSLNLNAEVYLTENSHTKVGFTISHLMIAEVDGKFTDFEASFDYDVTKKQLKDVKVNIKVASIDTEDKKRDDHLRSADFFDVVKYPNITFTSTEMITINPGETKNLKGKLTIKNVTKDVVLKVTYKGNVKDPMGNERIVFTAETKIDRRDFDIKWNKALDGGGVVVGNEVNIKVKGEALKKEVIEKMMKG